MSILVEAIFANDEWHEPAGSEIREDPDHPLGDDWYTWTETDDGVVRQYGARASAITMMRYTTRGPNG